jgi:hypothetical protein
MKCLIAILLALVLVGCGTESEEDASGLLPGLEGGEAAGEEVAGEEAGDEEVAPSGGGEEAGDEAAGEEAGDEAAGEEAGDEAAGEEAGDEAAGEEAGDEAAGEEGLSCGEVLTCISGCTESSAVPAEQETCSGECIVQGSQEAQNLLNDALICVESSGCEQTDLPCLQAACAAELSTCMGL